MINIEQNWKIVDNFFSKHDRIKKKEREKNTDEKCFEWTTKIKNRRKKKIDCELIILILCIYVDNIYWILKLWVSFFSSFIYFFVKTGSYNTITQAKGKPFE